MLSVYVEEMVELADMFIWAIHGREKSLTIQRIALTGPLICATRKLGKVGKGDRTAARTRTIPTREKNSSMFVFARCPLVRISQKYSRSYAAVQTNTPVVARTKARVCLRFGFRPQVPKLAMLSPEEVGAMGNFYDEARPSFQWSYHSPYLQVWKHCTSRERAPNISCRHPARRRIILW